MPLPDFVDHMDIASQEIGGDDWKLQDNKASKRDDTDT